MTMIKKTATRQDYLDIINFVREFQQTSRTGEGRSRAKAIEVSALAAVAALDAKEHDVDVEAAFTRDVLNLAL